MAITGGDRYVWRTLRQADLIPERPAVLEIGRACWYGDVSGEQFVQDWKEFSDHSDAGRMHERQDLWTMADWYYDTMLRRPTRTAIDLDPGTYGALRLDLNEPLPGYLCDEFDIVINTGTAEHVFDQAQVWRSMHDATRPGGLMVHSLPLWGWLDHGFVNYHPTFVRDIAAENGYRNLVWLAYEIDTGWCEAFPPDGDARRWQDRAKEHSALMHVAFRKESDEPFRAPMQGVYSDRARPELVSAWAAAANR